MRAHLHQSSNLFALLRRSTAIAGIGLLLLARGMAAPSDEADQVTLVAGLYKKFAWQAMAGSNEVFGKALAQQDSPALRRHFDTELTDLLVRDRECAERRGAPCGLDFDPLFASRQPGATDLSIRAREPGLVTVDFRHPASDARIELEYRLQWHAGQWRISDIRYPDWRGSSLKRLLEGGRDARPASTAHSATAGIRAACPSFNSIKVAPPMAHQASGSSHGIQCARAASSTPSVATTVGSGAMPATSARLHPCPVAGASKG